MSNEFVSALSARVNAGSMILNDYLLELSEISGGHRLTVTRGSEVQSMDVMDGGAAAVQQVQADYLQNNSSQPDYIKNRPCYNNSMGDTVFWDGNIEGRETVWIPLVQNGEEVEMPCCRIADNPPSLDALQNGYMRIVLNNGQTITTDDSLRDISTILEDGFAMLASLYVMVVPHNNYTLEDAGLKLVFPRRGVYATKLGEVCLKSTHIAGHEFGSVKQLDAKCVPGFEPVRTDRIEWDGSFDDREVVAPESMPGMYFVHVSDCAPDTSAFDQGAEMGMWSNTAGNSSQNISSEEISGCIAPLADDVYCFFEMMIVVARQDNARFDLNSEIVILPRKGVYFAYVTDPSTGDTVGYINHLAAPLLQAESGVVLQDGVIPGSIQRVGGDVILHSSTEGSTKKFRLRVDDSGAITAAEISQ